jgi:predicted esterase
MSSEQAFRELRQLLMQLYEQGKHASALEMLEQASDSFPDRQAHLLFWRMCLLSLCNRPQDVLALLQRGLDSGLWWAASQFKDSDLDRVRDLPEFQRLVQISDEKAQMARTQVKPERAVLVPDGSAPPWPMLIALHGRSGNKLTQLPSWQAAHERGWLVVSPQSTQPLFTDAYCWDDAAMGMKDILFQAGDIGQMYRIDPLQIVIGGFSQGGGMAIHAALCGQIPVRGFIGVATFWQEPQDLLAPAQTAKDVRGYFVIGENDDSLQRTRQIQAILKQNRIPYEEEVHPNLGHEFPADFGASLDRALQFILEGQPSQSGQGLAVG